MWLTKAKEEEEQPLPERLRYSRYYEHDGALRAYANRSMVLAFLSVPTAMIAARICAGYCSRYWFALTTEMPNFRASDNKVSSPAS